MTTFKERLVQCCHEELARFASGERTETDDPQYKFVKEYWSSIGVPYDGRTKVKNRRGGWYRPAWSAAFVSFVIRKAGAGPRFVYKEAHCHYVHKAMQLADGVASNHGYIARRPNTYSPTVGDIIVAGREYASQFTYDQAKMAYAADSFYPSHGDIVVKVNPSTIETIGGNVTRDTVGRRRPGISTNGRLAGGAWIAVLECLL